MSHGRYKAASKCYYLFDASRKFVLFIMALCLITLSVETVSAQRALPQRTMKWEALAERLVDQLQLEPGEKVISLGHIDMFPELIPHLRYAVMKTGAIDLGVLNTLEEPFPENWDVATLRDGFAKSRAAYIELLKDVDVAIMLPGANPVQPAYGAMQMLLFNEGGARRTIHFHWSQAYSSSGNKVGLMGVTVLPGHSPPPMQVIDQVYQRAVLETDLAALAEHQERFSAAMKNGLVRITSPAGTDISFRIGDRDIIRQNGDASAARMREATAFLTREVELPAGVVRVAPLEVNVTGTVVYPFSAWNGQSVVNARLSFENGKIVNTEADVGAEHLEAELANAPQESLQFREFGLGFNPLLAIPKDIASWIPYFGYGAGIVRLGIGANMELGGAVPGRYYRWRDFLTDATVTIDGAVWVKGGNFVQ
jgi:hypothetical protein